VFCSYLHGPLLPKNSHLTDYLLKLALERRSHKLFIERLDDSFEESARRVMLRRMGLK
jgi:CobQ-like glutamine amidotransferase family enzyme